VPTTSLVRHSNIELDEVGIDLTTFEIVYAGSATYFRARKASFENGWGKCSACDAWIDVQKPDNEVIEFNARGVRYHKKKFCNWSPGAIRRIRMKPKIKGKKKHNNVEPFRY
jgi:hypothetical protein